MIHRIAVNLNSENENVRALQTWLIKQNNNIKQERSKEIIVCLQLGEV